MQQPDSEVTVALAEQMQREAERAYAAGDLEAILASFDPDLTIRGMLEIWRRNTSRCASGGERLR